MKKNILKHSLLLLFLLPMACQEEEYELGTPAEADFEVLAIEGDPNRVKLIAHSDGTPSIKKWDLGNGTNPEGDTVIAYFPFEGEYNITLTNFSRGGATKSTGKVNISETDPEICNDQTLDLLTGGCDKPEGKTWVVDASTKGHFGLGPRDGAGPDWYAANPNEKAGGGLYDDLYNFQLINYKADFETNGDVFIRADQAANFPDAYPNLGDMTAPYNAPDGLTYAIDQVGNDTFLKINSGGFIGYYTGVNRYQIMTLTENLLVLKYYDAKDPAFAWYLRLIPEGTVAPPPPTATFPITFEAAKPPFGGFGGTTFDVVDNPSATGINTSAKVGKYVKGTEGSWAGIETLLAGPLDFSTNTLIKYKVYSPVAGRALFKLESTTGAADPVEVFADVTKVNEWQELTFDFADAPSGVFNKIAMFLDFDNNNGGTFYIDDIRQAAVPASLTAADLTGGSAKAWVLKPAAGSFKVGPTKGSAEWFGSADLSADRPCLFNDEYIFKTGGVYEYATNGDIFGEPYLGVDPAGCADESALAADAQAWGSGTHSFSFTPATDAEPAYITVTGTGAHIALPKAYNGGEYSAGPPTADGSVKYEVLSYVKNATSETLTITIDVSEGQAGTAFWTFVLVPQQ